MSMTISPNDERAATTTQSSVLISRSPSPLLNDSRSSRGSSSSGRDSASHSTRGSFNDRRPSESSRSGRGSFSSIKEDLDSGIAQSFILSNPKDQTGPTQEQQNKHDMMFLEWTPSGGFKGAQEVNLHTLKSKVFSRSVPNLSALLGWNGTRGWDWEKGGVEFKSLKTIQVQQRQRTAGPKYAPGCSPVERLPVEVFELIVPLLAVETPSEGYNPRNVDLVNCLLVSRTFHSATLATLYNKVTIPHSFIFNKFLDRITDFESLGTLVRRLDFSHFTPVASGSGKLTADSLSRGLSLTPRLKEFLVQEHLANSMDENVLGKLFQDLPVLNAVDFCASSSSIFKTAFTSVINKDNAKLPLQLPIRRLGLHECNTIPPAALEVLLSRLPRLTHLDACHTQITDKALFSIPHTARLTHLNLSKCGRLSSSRVVEFLTTHPAVKDTLVELNLLSPVGAFLSYEDVEQLLPKLPSCLRSLNLRGAKLSKAHVKHLLPLSKHVEELSLGLSELGPHDLDPLFFPPKPEEPSSTSDEVPNGDEGDPTKDDDNEEKEEKEEPQPWVPHSIRYLDLAGGYSISSLLSPTTYPLEVIEVGENDQPEPIRAREKTFAKQWVRRECGRRTWYVRIPPAGEQSEDGTRDWKMGASWWGMRKTPVAVQEVGGLYGYYMFKK
jgi:hypothetical protein